MGKLRMQVDDLRVESFATDGANGRRGTVRAHGDCTWIDSCFCDTAYAVCGTGPETVYSCDYTVNELCERTAFECPDTSWQVCGTPPITPVC